MVIFVLLALGLHFSWYLHEYKLDLKAQYLKLKLRS